MRLANLTLLLIALLGCATGNTQSESGVDERVVIHATAATAGLYSDRWDVRLVLDGTPIAQSTKPSSSNVARSKARRGSGIAMRSP